MRTRLHGAAAALLWASTCAGCGGSASARDLSGDAGGSATGPGAGAPGADRDASSGGPAGGQDGASADRADCKRGVAYGHHSVADQAVLSKAVSWWYNWAPVPGEALRSGAYRDLGVEYVPMVWGEGFEPDEVTSAIPQGARTLLGFNEPNFFSQANLSATQAAALWPKVEQIADARGLALASPAVNYCGGGCNDTDPVSWLDAFFAACPGCRVDAIAVHVYVGCNPPGDNHAQWLIEKMERYKAEFTQPLWLTEFACDDAATMQDQVAFLKDAVTWLEAEPRVARYAWFSGRADNMQNVDLLGEDGALTELGEAYVNQPQPEECAR